MERKENCPLCGSGHLIPWGSEEIVRRERWKTLAESERQLLLSRLGKERVTRSLSLCPSCSFLFQNPAYDSGELGRLYAHIPGEYARFALAAGIPVDLLWESPRARENLRERQQRYAEIVLSGGAGSVHDYGGGNGANLRGPSRASVERSVYDCGQPETAAAGVTVVDGLGTVPRFDCILHTHVLEHEPDPLDSLRKLRSVIRPGGFLYLEVPFEYGERLVSRRPGAVWHVGFFNRRTILIASARAGWVCERLDLADLPYSTERIACISAILRPGPVSAVSPSALRTGADVLGHLVRRAARNILT
jgi:SAM-dependent methyltransferase